MKNEAIWKGKAEAVFYPKLQSAIETDVVIIGGGITGITAAIQLAEAGKKVVVVEAYTIGSGTTGFSSCHLTTDIDYEYRNIASSFDEETAKIVATSRMAAINYIERISTEKNIKCDFRRLPGYLYTEVPEDVESIKEEARAASTAGLKVSLLDSIPFPLKINKALKFEDQGEFNAQKYLSGLAKYFVSIGGLIFENSLVNNFVEKDLHYEIQTGSGSVTVGKVILATHLPIFFNILQSFAAPYRSYMLAARLKYEPLPGLFWDTAEPYHYIRFYQKDNVWYVVVGGADHKTGHVTHTEERYRMLEKYVRDRFDIESIDYEWSAQYYEPADGLPFIGRSPFSKNIFVATGFSGDGLVYGTIAGIIIPDLILGKKNSWLKAYDSTRFTPANSAVDFIKENADVVKNFIKDRWSGNEHLDSVEKGEGKIIKMNGENLAVSRDEEDELHAVSAVCTHMKCLVHWNYSEKTWDCPCHGSRFNMDGKVLYGPAVKALTPKEAEIKMEENKK